MPTTSSKASRLTASPSASGLPAFRPDSAFSTARARPRGMGVAASKAVWASRAWVEVYMAVHIGTSGWSYDHWVDILYPKSASSLERLDAYARRFQTVEVNNTFYRWPKDE